MHTGLFIYTRVALASLIVAVAPAAAAQEADRAVTRWIATHLVPLADEGDLRGMRAMVGRARLVMLGEPAHGAHEPLAFRNQLFRALVEHSGFTAIALETGLPESVGLQAWIDGGEGDVRQVARNYFTWGFGDFEENIELLQWMQRFNARAARGQRLRIYGLDLGGGNLPDTTRLVRSLQGALEWLARADPAVAAWARVRLTSKERDQQSAGIGDLVAELELQRVSEPAMRDVVAYEWALRSAVAARQLDAFLRAGVPRDRPADRTRWDPRPMSARDAAMADNVRWVLEQEGERGRILVYAHNVHVMNATLVGGMWDAFTAPPPMMGRYVRAMLGSEAFIIGTSAASNGPGLPQPTIDPTGIDAVLARTGVRRFAIDLRAPARTETIARWLGAAHPLRANVTTHHLIAPDPSFDAMVYLGTLTRAHRSPPPR